MGAADGGEQAGGAGRGEAWEGAAELEAAVLEEPWRMAVVGRLDKDSRGAPSDDPGRCHRQEGHRDPERVEEVSPRLGSLLGIRTLS